jgi:replicative DNA helicase
MEQVLADNATERALLAGIITYGSQAYYDVCDIVNTKSFVDELHQALFECLEYILKDNCNVKVDRASIMSAATALGYSEVLEKNNIVYRAIVNFPIELSNVRKMAARIKKLQVGRDLDLQLKKAQQQIRTITGDEPIDHIIALAEQPISDYTATLTENQYRGPQLMGEGVHEYIDHLVNNPVEQVGISTSYPIFDKAIGGGLRRRSITLVGARPKIGKTTFGDNSGIHIAGQLGFPVLNIDTEMSKEDHRIRILANLAEVPIEEIETGKFAQNSWKKEKIRKAMDRLAAMPYYYESVAGKPFEEVLSIMRRWVNRVVGYQDNGEANNCVIIYDYLKLMGAEGLNRNMQEYQLLGFQIISLHNFMTRHGIPCLAFIQLNRDGITKEETDVISGSDRQAWTCANLNIFKKKSDDELAEDPTSNRKLINLFTRYGAGLDEGDWINMQFKGQFNKIVELKTRNQLKSEKDKATQGFIVNDTKPDEQIPFN